MILIIDTATKYLYVSLVEDEKVIVESKTLGKNDHSKTLMPKISEVFKENKLTVKDISSIIVGVGPGSYTGVRIGVIVAKTLAYDNDIDIREISTLKLMSSGLESAASIIDARRGEAFVSLFDVKNEVIDVHINDRFGCKSEFLDEVSLLSDATINEGELITNPLVIIKNSKLSNEFDIVPNYLRQTEAERNLGE